MSEVRALKVLVSAFAFSPTKGSEFSVGWNYVRAIAVRHKVWVIARSSERDETEAYLRQHPDAMPNVTVHYIPFPSHSFKFPMWELVFYPMMRQWQRKALKLGCALDAEINFDLIHHVTATGFREPGYLWKITKPFVWGPVGGLQYFPIGLLSAVPFRSRLFFLLKNLSTLWAMHISRRPRRAAATVQAMLVPSCNVADKVRTLWGRDATVSCEVSAPDLEPGPLARRGVGEPLRIIWSGSCEARKALNIVLLALERLKRSSVDWQLTVVGDGPLWGTWKVLAERLGLGERCTFLGRVSRAEVLSVMATGHCFVQPSLYDATSTVVVEALSCGLPVICLDHFGFKDVVNAECGVKIPPNRLDQVIRDFANAIEALWLDEDRRHKMALAAQKASADLTWKHKEQVINEVYSYVLSQMVAGWKNPSKSDIGDHCSHEANNSATHSISGSIEKLKDNVL
jgi:glycosyltransferase involved in cell wall biosynthesis